LIPDHSPIPALTDAFTLALRQHVEAQDRPLAALDRVARSIAALLAQGKEQADETASQVLDRLAHALRAAVAALWVEYGGEPSDCPWPPGAPH